jgi:tetratricopeptide (TPR) repeat protein
VSKVTAALQDAKIPSSKFEALLGRIVDALPGGDLIEDAAPAATEGRVSQSGRSVLPHIIDTRPSSEATLARREAAERRRHEAEQHFESALALEESDITAARTAYFAALDVHRDHLEARINLGRLLHLNGELAQAEKVYREARHASALLSFNLAILLEDLNREDEAVAAYREALALDPSLHDAHFNLSRLHEEAERPQDALRHLLAYRRNTLDEDD